MTGGTPEGYSESEQKEEMEMPFWILRGRIRQISRGRRSRFEYKGTYELRKISLRGSRWIRGTNSCPSKLKAKMTDSSSNLSRMLPMEIKMKVTTNDEHEVKREWNFCKCHYPGCTYINTKACTVDSHVKATHKEMKKDMKTLGLFWGTLYIIIKVNLKMTIA
jgi:hypothetical protein